MAKIHLRAHFTITGDANTALVMDCDRANFRFRAVAKTFAELEASEPSAEVLAEGRIVMAAALADQRMYAEAIELLTKAGAAKQLRNPRIDTFVSGTPWRMSTTGPGPHVGARAVRACRHRRAGRLRRQGRLGNSGRRATQESQTTHDPVRRKSQSISHRRDDRPHRNFVPAVSSSLSFISIIA